MARPLILIPILLTLALAATLSPAPASAQSELTLIPSASGATAPASTCVRLTQEQEWVSDPVLTHPLMPFFSGSTAAWGTFAGVAVLLYLLAFALFQGKVRSGANPLATFGKSMIVWFLLVGLAGYFLTAHLAYAESWCLDVSGEVAPGIAPARSNAEVVDRFGVDINEIVDRRAIPFPAHVRLTPWYFWLGGTLFLVLISYVWFRPQGQSSGSSPGTGGGRSAAVEQW